MKRFLIIMEMWPQTESWDDGIEKPPNAAIRVTIR